MRLSPLFGTAMVALVLGLLAIPLRHLTGADPAAGPGTLDATAAVVPAAGKSTPAVVRVRLLREASSAELHSDNEQLLWKAENVPSGETEAEIPLAILRGEAILHLHAEFPNDGTDTAVFVSVFPDGLEDRTAYGIGGGSVNERLVFTWPEASHDP